MCWRKCEGFWRKGGEGVRLAQPSPPLESPRERENGEGSEHTSPPLERRRRGGLPNPLSPLVASWKESEGEGVRTTVSPFESEKGKG